MLAERLPYDDPMSKSWVYMPRFAGLPLLANGSQDICCIWGCSSENS